MCTVLAGGPSDSNCETPVDIGIFIDASSSIQSHYNDYMTVIKGLADKFPISEDQSHIGVVSFSNDKSTVVGLQEYLTTDSFKESLSSLPKPDGKSDLGAALEKSYRSLFESKAARSNVAKIIILITDGYKKSNAGEKSPEQIAETLRGYGAKVRKTGKTVLKFVSKFTSQ